MERNRSCIDAHCSLFDREFGPKRRVDEIFLVGEANRNGKCTRETEDAEFSVNYGTENVIN